MIEKKKNKCENCTKRFIGCHSVCEDYKNFKEYMQKIKEVRMSKHDSDIPPYVRRKRK